MKTPIVPERLTRRRVEAGLTQTDLARMAGISKAHLSAVEKGKANFSPPYLRKISEALGCTIADLLPEDSAASSGSPA
ncbi:helix-turn-helix transcriptional regulator [Streptomyces sp. NPDC087659]|uniref:helix-turn-helix transcriptional regulator n=1 Tax=Streptomyces sp. NPDC087659 TaxID=3365801 RepID=UPI0038131CA7